MDITAERAKYGLPPLQGSTTSPSVSSVQPTQQSVQQPVDTNINVNLERSKYGLPPIKGQVSPVTPTTTQPAVEEDKGFFSSRGPSFESGTGGTEDIGGNLLKTVGNIPSSARDFARSSVAPVNLFDIETRDKYGKGVEDVKGIASNFGERGLSGTLKDIGSGFVDTAKKGIDLYRKGGEVIYNKLEENVLNRNSVTGGLKDSAVQAVSKVAETGIEDPLLIPSLLYGGGKAKAATAESKVLNKTDDIISDIARPVTSKVDEGIAKVTNSAKDNAINQLEQTYDDLFKGQSPSKAKKYKRSVDSVEFKNKAGTEGVAPARVLAEAGEVPKLSGNRLDTLEQAEDFRKKVQPLKDTNVKALEELDLSVEPSMLRTIQNDAISNIMKGNLTPELEEAAINKIKKSFEATRNKHGDRLGLKLQDELKSRHWDATKFDTAVPQLDRDIQYAMGKAYQKNIERVADRSGYKEIAQLNRHIGDQLEAAKFLEGLNGKAVRGGSLTKLVYGAVGSTFGTTALGKILGLLGGEAVANILMNLKISGPVRRMLLKNIQKKDPAAYTRALKWLQDQGLARDLDLSVQKRLPAPKSKIAGDGRTIQLPKETASSIDKKEALSRSSKYKIDGKPLSKEAEVIIDTNKDLSRADKKIVMEDMREKNPQVYKDVIEYENLARRRTSLEGDSIVTGKKKSVLNRLRDKIENTPNKQGGFIKNPLSKSLSKELDQADSFDPSAIKAKNIHPEDVEAIDSFITKARLSEDISDKLFNQIEKLAQKWNISMDLGLKKVADKLEDILSGKTKVKGTLVPGSLK
jgi:hypothetical protein